MKLQIASHASVQRPHFFCFFLLDLLPPGFMPALSPNLGKAGLWVGIVKMSSEIWRKATTNKQLLLKCFLNKYKLREQSELS